MKESESSKLYLEIRNLMMMIIIPKRIHKKDSEQGAYLRSSIVRVSLVYNLSDTYLNLSWLIKQQLTKKESSILGRYFILIIEPKEVMEVLRVIEQL